MRVRKNAAAFLAASPAAGEQLAEAAREAGVLFDAAHVEAAVDAACAEYQAELAEARELLAVMGGARRQRDAVLRLCEGRRGDDLLLVSAVAVAAECGTTALDNLPMLLTWTGDVEIPGPGDQSRAVVRCVSSYGGRADLVVEGDARVRLASLVDSEVRDIHAPCPTVGCGTISGYGPSGSAFRGWVRVEVAGLDDAPCWYCSPMCVADALARAGERLAAADQAAAASEGGAR